MFAPAPKRSRDRAVAPYPAWRGRGAGRAGCRAGPSTGRRRRRHGRSRRPLGGSVAVRQDFGPSRLHRELATAHRRDVTQRAAAAAAGARADRVEVPRGPCSLLLAPCAARQHEELGREADLGPDIGPVDARTVLDGLHDRRLTELLDVDGEGIGREHDEFRDLAWLPRALGVLLEMLVGTPDREALERLVHADALLGARIGRPSTVPDRPGSKRRGSPDRIAPSNGGSAPPAVRGWTLPLRPIPAWTQNLPAASGPAAPDRRVLVAGRPGHRACSPALCPRSARPYPGSLGCGGALTGATSGGSVGRPSGSSFDGSAGREGKGRQWFPSCSRTTGG